MKIKDNFIIEIKKRIITVLTIVMVLLAIPFNSVDVFAKSSEYTWNADTKTLTFEDGIDIRQNWGDYLENCPELAEAETIIFAGDATVYLYVGDDDTTKLKNLVFNGKTTLINYCSFSNVDTLETIKFKDDVVFKTASENFKQFSNCSNLKSVEFDKSIEFVGNETIDIFNGVGSIEDYRIEIADYLKQNDYDLTSLTQEGLMQFFGKSEQLFDENTFNNLCSIAEKFVEKRNALPVELDKYAEAFGIFSWIKSCYEVLFEEVTPSIRINDETLEGDALGQYVNFVTSGCFGGGYFLNSTTNYDYLKAIKDAMGDNYYQYKGNEEKYSEFPLVLMSGLGFNFISSSYGDNFTFGFFAPNGETPSLPLADGTHKLIGTFRDLDTQLNKSGITNISAEFDFKISNGKVEEIKISNVDLGSNWDNFWKELFETEIEGGTYVLLKQPHIHQWAYASSGSILSAYCSTEDCDQGVENAITLNIETKDSIVGSAPTAKIVDKDGIEIKSDTTNNWTTAGLSIPNIEYYSGDTKLENIPTTSGSYTVKAIMKDAQGAVLATVSKKFYIVDTPMLVKEDTNDLTVSSEKAVATYTEKATKDSTIHVAGLNLKDFTKIDNTYKGILVTNGTTVLRQGVDYTVTEGSIKINLTKAYLDTLSVGTHTITTYVRNSGTAGIPDSEHNYSFDATITIKAKPSNPTPTSPTVTTATYVVPRTDVK